MFVDSLKMALCRVLWLCAFIVLNVLYCDCQFSDSAFMKYNPAPKAVPFPTCRVDDIDCLRRGLRTFFFLMDSGHLGMKPVDPAIINSVAITAPEHQMSILLRNLNVTGARWTKLLDRKFGLSGSRSTAIFSSDLHVTGDIIMKAEERPDPFVAFLTMDIQGVESNVTYSWRGQRGIDNYDYILLGQERIAVRNTRTPTFFLQPDSEESNLIDLTLQMKPAIIDHLSNEITAALMHSIVDNFRLFTRIIPVHQFYQLYK